MRVAIDLRNYRYDESLVGVSMHSDSILGISGGVPRYCF